MQGSSTQCDIDGSCESEIARVGKMDTRAVTTVEATGNEEVIDRKPTIGGIGVRVRAGDSREAARTRATGAAETNRAEHWPRKADAGVIDAAHTGVRAPRAVCLDRRHGRAHATCIKEGRSIEKEG